MIEFPIPGTFPSVLNLREHWAAKARRVKKQRHDAWTQTCINVSLADRTGHRYAIGTITLTRYAPRKLDGDNLAGALKAVRDGIASALGVDDGDPRVSWAYGQERCKAGEQHVRVTVEAALRLRDERAEVTR